MWDHLYFQWILKGTTNKHCTRSRHGQWWPMNGANVENFSNCFCMHWNFTWIDYLHALIIWEGFWTKIWLTYPLVSIINSSCKPQTLFSFKVHRLVDTIFKLASAFLHFSFRFYIVYIMYVCHSCDEKYLFLFIF